ncbi:MAG: selenocysteine-specific translation elongation factor, partial [Christensenellaceae bacterium]|nr:selenocysteine-specific translation elongation factor [Christensenellaceae bacterium]
MKNLIIGTAGHVDHGKSTLINALTGIDTDRLIEEKKRGITIDLGFAYLTLPDGTKAGIVDVPGHEKFIKNMLAGAGGMDIAMFVVAADEGFMPQTIEHLDILSLLNIKQGLVVITKIDLVDNDWIDAVEDDVIEHVKGTFLEGAPILKVSAIKGTGIEELKNTLFDMLDKAEAKNINTSFRLPIDRVFTITGHGTVITGTLIEGTLNLDDVAEIYPSNVRARIRNIQVHGKSVDVAYAGQRVALNLAGLKKEDIDRGNVVAAENSLKESFLLDVKINMLNNTQRQIKNGDSIHFHHGSSVLLAKVVLFNCESISAGENAYAQLRFTEPIATKAKDYFVLRFYSPLETIAGGIIIDPNPTKHRRNDKNIVKSLQIKESGSLKLQVLNELENNKIKLEPTTKMHAKLAITKEQFDAELDALQAEGQVFNFEDYSISKNTVEYYRDLIKNMLEAYHKENPLIKGLKVHDVRLQLFPKLKANIANFIVNLAIYDDSFKVDNNIVALKEHKPNYTPELKKIREEVLNIYLNAKIEAPTVDEIIKDKGKAKLNYQKIISALVNEDVLIPISGDYMLHADVYNNIMEKAKAAW